MENTLNQNQRNYGIDLLRILSMFLVVVLHTLGHGGVLQNCISYSLNYYTAWFLETAAYCAVDVFAMITGYVMINTKFSSFKIIPLWLTVFFYSLIIPILFKIVPSLSLLHEVTFSELIKGIFFPVLSIQYWYFTSYFGMYFFIPFINKLLQSLGKKEHRNLCITIIVIFSILPVVTLKRVDLFYTGFGFSTLWLICLYIFGAYFKMYPVQISKKKCFALYFGSIFFAWFAKLMSHVLLKIIFSKDAELDLFIDYTSIFIISSGVALLLLFSQIKIEIKFLQKIIITASSLSFSVYLIHEHPFIRSLVINNRFSLLANSSAYILPLQVLFYALCIFLSCLLIDIVRYMVFKILRINRIPKLLQNKINKAYK